MRKIGSMKRYMKLLAAMLFVWSYVVSPVNASSFVEPPAITNREKAHLNISFTGGEGTGVCSVVGSQLNGNDNRERAYNYFVSKGFTAQQAAGIIGNFMVESGVNPMRVQGAGVQESKTLPSSGGYGIAQWDDRKQNLANYARQQGRPLYDLSLQLDFVMYELGGSERAANDAFKATTNIVQATTVWMERYERPGVPALSTRIQEARDAFSDFSGGADENAEQPTASSSASCGGSGNVVSIAQAELAKGVLEDPIGCDQGNPSTPGDCGAEVNKYTDNTLEYWCADFVSWVYKQAGLPFSGGTSGGWRIPSAEGVQAYMEKKGTFTANSPSAPDPQPGDIYIINEGQHVGIVVKVENGALYTISGNTSTENYSNGVGVGEAVYQDFKSNSTISGYGGLR